MLKRVIVGLTLLLGMALGYPWDPDFILTHHLASKSPYRALQNFSSHTPPPAKCTPFHFNLISRHGNRNPGDGDIEEYDRLASLIVKYDRSLRFDYMRGFKSPVAIEDEGKLVVRGMNEQYYLAKRLQQAYPEIFSAPYDSDVYFMRATQEQRAMMSGDAHAYSLFERKGKIGPDFYEPHFILSDTESQDNILKYYDNCRLYVETVGDNDTAIIERDFYLEKILPGIAARLATVVTVDGSWEVTGDDVLAFHSLCQTQAAIQGIEDQFCTLFLQSELEALEYWEDLDDYYSKAYPYPINYQMAAPLLQDVVISMVDALNDVTPQRANLRFAHSSTVVPLISVFGLYKDAEQLRADTPQETIDRRLFRTSVVSTMGANFAVVLYKCEKGEPIIKVLQNEKEVHVAGCPSIYCPLQTFRDAYASYLNQDFDLLCENDKKENKKTMKKKN